MDKSIFAFIWRYSRREQIIVLLTTLASFPVLYLSLEVPKTIVNEALTDNCRPQQLLGIEFEQIAYLLLLCVVSSVTRRCERCVQNAHQCLQRHARRAHDAPHALLARVADSTLPAAPLPARIARRLIPMVTAEPLVCRSCEHCCSPAR